VDKPGGVGTTFADDICRVEVKVIFESSELGKTIKRLDLSNEQHGHVYFYDTNNLNLLDKGVILRIRSGDSDNDLTVKIRPQTASRSGTPREASRTSNAKETSTTAPSSHPTQ
jgi:uncharacterized protein YjbK